MPFLPPNQQHQGTKKIAYIGKINLGREAVLREEKGRGALQGAWLSLSPPSPSYGSVPLASQTKFLFSVIRHLWCKFSDYTWMLVLCQKLHFWTHDQHFFSGYHPARFGHPWGHPIGCERLRFIFYINLKNSWRHSICWRRSRCLHGK